MNVHHAVEPSTPRERREVTRDMTVVQAKAAVDDMIREFGRDYAIEFFMERLRNGRE